MTAAQDGGGAVWLGLEHVDEREWRLPVTRSLVSGATALFGGCATAAGVVVARSLVTQPVVWAGSHFGTLAPLGATVTLRPRVISSGRTMAHVEVVGEFDGKDAFLVRVTAGERPVQQAEGQWVPPPEVEPPADCAAFAHPVHEDSWAARFDWRLAGRGESPDAPWAAWWVRPRAGEPDDTAVHAIVLVDYVTYGIGRALGVAMGGLSIDNVVRFHRVTSAPWFLLEVRPEAIEGGFGYGAARLFADDVLVATGTQSVVVNGWDWRLPGERTEEPRPGRAAE